MPFAFPVFMEMIQFQYLFSVVGHFWTGISIGLNDTPGKKLGSVAEFHNFCEVRSVSLPP